jgi:2-dehydropantoate 2-reductase
VSRHGVLGAGGVGLLVGGVLARAGHDVVLVMRERSLQDFDDTIRVESAVLGSFDAQAHAVSRLDEHVDALWMSPKATALDAALELAPPAHAGLAVTLMNGVEHAARLRARGYRVVAGSIWVESERSAVGSVRQSSPFLRVVLAPGGEALVEELRAAGISRASVGASEAAVLWTKLAFLAPVALATSAANAPLGAVRNDPELVSLLERCRDEVCAAAAAEGAPQDVPGLCAFLENAPADIRSSMQKDIAAGREPELDAIAGAIVRAAARHGLRVPATEELMRRVSARASSR